MNKRMANIFAWVLIFSFAWGYDTALSQISGNRTTYTVQQGDTFQEIAENLGSPSFWKALYRANKALINDSGMLEPGQVLRLPPAVTESPKFAYPSLRKTVSEADSTVDPELKEFREAFNRVLSNGDNNPKDQRSQDPTLQLGGFVLDETISKMGRNFYTLFYQHWKAPEGASNYTLTITEQPAIGRGTQVTVMLDYDKIFTARLQPRYEYIDALSQQAVARSHKIYKQLDSVEQQLMGY